ncbi:MAG: DUF4157 domain-containing protein [Planctomycetes bacterium]|nr:DUF4157 domain-containing protein [Planctomycetota bacterium]
MNRAGPNHARIRRPDTPSPHTALSARRPQRDPHAGAAALEAAADRSARAAGCQFAACSRGHAANDQAGPAPIGTGQHLSDRLRAELERHFGLDLSRLRVHRDADAQQAADEAGALAFARGTDLVFGAGAWSPDTPTGRALLLHEAAHAAQHLGGRTGGAMLRDERTEGGLGQNPPAAAYTVGTGSVAEEAHVLFGRNGAELDQADRKAIAAFADTIAKPALVEVGGYASSEGDEEYNQNLSAHRAVVVAEALRLLLPNGSVVRAVAYGSTSAFGEQRKTNRRAGIHLVGPAPASPDTTAEPELPPAEVPSPDAKPPDLAYQVPPYDPTQLPPWTFRPILHLSPESLDYGPLGRSAGMHGLPLSGRWGESAEGFYWQSREGMESLGLPPGWAHTWAQWSTESALDYRLQFEHPTQWDEWKKQDQIHGTAPKTLSIDVLKLPGYWQQLKKAF